jgi:hypothetical protein
MANASMTQAKNEVEGAVRVASPWIERLARMGYFAKGVLYLVIGILAFNVAFNSGGQTPDTQDALQTIAAQPFGQILLTLIVIGLVGYAIWLFARGIMDTEDEGSDMSGLGRRVSFVARAVGHLILAFIALQLLMGSGGGSDGNNTASLTARAMEQPWGRWLVGLVGLGFIAVGLSRLYLAYSERFREKLQLNKMSSTEQDWMIWTGRLGIASQGVVLAMIGSFLIQAAIQYDPSEARGLGGALQELLEQPYGLWLLGLMALGFIAHGIYMFIRGRYRRIEVA